MGVSENDLARRGVVGELEHPVTGREFLPVVPRIVMDTLYGAAIGATLFLRERISTQRWLGVLVVCIGVTLVWLSRR